MVMGCKTYSEEFSLIEDQGYCLEGSYFVPAINKEAKGRDLQSAILVFARVDNHLVFLLPGSMSFEKKMLFSNKDPTSITPSQRRTRMFT
jgi:hypothetical protein